MSDDLRNTAHLLFTPGQVVEVRAITEDGMASGYFDSPEKLAARVDALDGLPEVQGIYVTLNEVNPALLARRSNRVKMRLSKKDATTADTDILRRQWFPVDVDPARPSGVSSTDEEHQAAIVRATEICAYLGRECGWPAPVLADSGNGAHLLYRIDLLNDDASRDLVKRCLEALSLMFGDQVAEVDTANHNAARIWKLYGTMSRKGDNTEDRPHRRSAVLDAPSPVGVVSRELLERLAVALPDPPVPAHEKKPGKAGPAIELRSWLSGYGIGVKVEKPYQGGTLYVLDECPFSSGHKDGAFAIQFLSGAIYAGCHHASCGGGEQRWPELREAYEPGKEKEGNKEKEKRETRPLRPPGGSTPDPAMEGMPGRVEALAVLQQGDPKRAMLRAFALDHEGDETAAECLALSFASRSVLNTNGLHVSVTGESGKGKSHAFSTMLQQFPDRFRIDGALSNKALFYIDAMQPGTVIIIDDNSLSDDMAAILKGVTTSFKKPFIYRTVNKDRKGQICTIPERCVWWVAKVEGVGDDQVFNRMLTCWIDDTREQDDRVLDRTLADGELLPSQGTEKRPELLVCRAMWEVIGQQRLHVVIPFSRRIRFQTHDNRRNPGMLLDLIKAHALLHFMQREAREDGGTPYIIATKEDFSDAARLYGLLNGTDGGQATKLTKKESDLLNTIEQSGLEEFTIPVLQKLTELPNNTIHRIMQGYASRGATYSGLLEKCPAIAYTDRTVQTEDVETGAAMRRRTNAYTFDRDLYLKWRVGGAVWIDEDPSDDDDHLAASQQSRSNPTAVAARQENGTMNADSQINGTYTHICVDDHLSRSRSESTECGEPAPGCASLSLCDREVAARQDLKSDIKPPIPDKQPEKSGNSSQHLLRDAVGQSPIDAVAARYPHAFLAADYKRLDAPEGGATCFACGKTGLVFFVERLTADRKQRKEDPARRICQRCYDQAVRRERAAAPPLPGTINLAAMQRLQSDIGRCSVCDLDRAVYLDRDAGVRLCEPCHARESRQQVEGHA